VGSVATEEGIVGGAPLILGLSRTRRLVAFSSDPARWVWFASLDRHRRRRCADASAPPGSRSIAERPHALDAGQRSCDHPVVIQEGV